MITQCRFYEHKKPFKKKGLWTNLVDSNVKGRIERLYFIKIGIHDAINRKINQRYL